MLERGHTNLTVAILALLANLNYSRIYPTDRKYLPHGSHASATKQGQKTSGVDRVLPVGPQCEDTRTTAQSSVPRGRWRTGSVLLIWGPGMAPSRNEEEQVHPGDKARRLPHTPGSSGFLQSRRENLRVGKHAET